MFELNNNLSYRNKTMIKKRTINKKRYKLIWKMVNKKKSIKKEEKEKETVSANEHNSRERKTVLWLQRIRELNRIEEVK